LNKNIPPIYRQSLSASRKTIFSSGRANISARAFFIGAGLSFFLAIGAPYGNMIVRGSYMALDFSTPGAIFVFLFLIGILNVVLKIASKGPAWTVGAALMASGVWAILYWPWAKIDPYDPGFILFSIITLILCFNVPWGLRGINTSLNRAELVMVYAMLLMVASLCTLGLSEQILPMLTAMLYFASPQNKWQEKLLPHLPQRQVWVDDGNLNSAFYEGVNLNGTSIPYGAWVEPLAWWGIFLAALYLTMMGVAVILRRQWMDRERLSYPLAQVGLAMIQGEKEGQLVNDFFKRPAMWVGCSIPLFFGSLRALHQYEPSIPVFALQWNMAFVGKQSLLMVVSFAMLGFSYMINAQIAAGIWFFHLVSKVQKEALINLGLKADQKIIYGVADHPFLAYQGVGALIVMVLIGLWMGREHLLQVGRKALGLAGGGDDSDEIMSYRWATICAFGGMATMCFWLFIMGTPFWVALVFIVFAVLIFIGISRIVVEAGLAAVRSPMTAPDLVMQGFGSGLVGGGGVLNLSLAYIWAADVRVFVMATCANALKMIEELDPSTRRVVFGAMVAALFIGSLGAFWMIFHMAYRHGGINLNAWFFKGAPGAAFDNAVRQLGSAGVFWPGWSFFAGGGAVMGLLTLMRHRLPWWPFHPIGFPIGANSMMDHVWFSVFLAWVIKRAVMRYGGAGMYRRSQIFFMGLIVGQVLCNGMWLVIDYFTGKIGNRIFWV
jgi:hypothetical protein